MFTATLILPFYVFPVAFCVVYLVSRGCQRHGLSGKQGSRVIHLAVEYKAYGLCSVHSLASKG